jgi:hypothetical protein
MFFDGELGPSSSSNSESDNISEAGEAGADISVAIAIASVDAVAVYKEAIKTAIAELRNYLNAE